LCSRSAQKEGAGCGTDLPLFGGARSIIAMHLNATSLFLSATKHSLLAWGLMALSAQIGYIAP